MNPPLPEIQQVVIVGTGLLGASVALGLKARGYGGRVVGVGRRQSTLDAAMATGGFDAVTTDYAQVPRRPPAGKPGGKRSGELAPGPPEVVVVCVPLGGFDAAFRAIAAHDHAGLTITDAGSAKGAVLDAARRRLPDPTRFVGAHPMAGSERQGPAAGDGDLLVGRPCVICAAPDARPDAVARVRALWAALGMTLVPMSAAEHDRHAATISHLPHLAAAALVALAAGRDAWPLASTGFRDTTRVASGNPSLWRDILTANRPAVLDALAEFGDRLDALTRALRDGDDAAVLEQLEQAKARRDHWLHAASPTTPGAAPGPSSPHGDDT